MATIAYSQLELLGHTPPWAWWATAAAALGLEIVLERLRRRDPKKIDRLCVLVARITSALAALATKPVLLLSRDPYNAAAILWLAEALFLALLIYYRNIYTLLTPWRRRALIALRSLGFASLVLLLFRPIVSTFGGDSSDKPRISVVIDASASMGYNDAPNQPNRFRQAAIAVQSTLVPRLASAYQFDIFAYDGKHTQPIGAPDQLDAITPDGNVTDLGAAISLGLSAGKNSGNGGLAHAIIFSDGIHNGPIAIDAQLPKILAANPRVPVDTVRVGSSELEPSTVPDIAVVLVDGPQTAVVNNQVTLTASIKSTAMSDRTIRVSLLERAEPPGAQEKPNTPGQWKTLDEQRLVLHSSPTPQTVALKFTPDKVGRVSLRVSVPVDPGERSDANNQQDFALLVTDPKLSVLYVEGRVRPEFGPLRTALEQDPNLAAASLVQTTAGRFNLYGAKIGSGPNEIKGLPTTLAQWKQIKVIVIGDLDSSFLNTQQQKDLEQAVREGAGLLMIGGQNTFAPGHWDKTTLAALLPVSLDPVSPPQIDAPFVPKLTAMGAAHPIFRNISSFFIGPDNGKGTTIVPELTGCVALGPVKPGATVLAEHPTAQVNGQPAIVLAVQQYGQGRTAAFAGDTTWRWELALRQMKKDSPYNRFWGQLIRWLAAQEGLDKKTGPSVTAMLARERFDAGESVPLKAAVTDLQGQATNFAAASATVTGPDGVATKVDLAAPQEGSGITGIYAGTYKPAMAGDYQVQFTASKEGADLGKDQSTFSVNPAAGERDVLAADPKTLEAISRTTHGTAIDLSGIDALADRLLAETQPITATASIVPLYHVRGFFGLFVLALAAEWLLRRRWQLA